MRTDDNVLIVEDEDEWCRIFIRAVNAEGSNTTIKVANDQASAEELIDSTRFALAIVDVGLDISDDRNVDGLRVMSKIRDVGDETSILVVTGRSGQDALQVGRDALMEYHAYDTVGKSSIVPSKLRELVKQGLTRYRDTAVSSRTDARDAIRGSVNPMAWDDHVMRSTGFQGDAIKFYGFLDGLLGEYLPLLPSHGPAGQEHRPSVIAETFWSRAIGAAVLVCFGANDEFDQARAAFLDEVGLAGHAEPLRELKSHGVAGAVYRLPDRHRGEFGTK